MRNRLLTLLCATLLAGCDDSPMAPAAPVSDAEATSAAIAGLGPREAIIRGMVREKETGRPLPHANPHAPDLRRSVATDSAGAFEMRIDVPDGAYFIDVNFRARAIGYAPVQRRVRLLPGQVVELDVELKRDVINCFQTVVTGVSLPRR